MKNRLQRNWNFTMLILFTMSLLTACYEQALSPSQTVQHFWSALLNGDLNEAGDYVTTDSIAELPQASEDLKDASVSFGKIQLESNRAIIETTLTQSANTNKNNVSASTTFNTVLNKKDKLWKVNYIATKKSLDDAQRKKGLSKLVDDLENLGRDITGQLGGVLENWEKVTPEIKKDLEQLGDSVQKQLQESIDKHGPELQQKLEDFTDSLEDALKELEKSVPDKEEKDQQATPDGRMI